jgi:hypothetical protein
VIRHDATKENMDLPPYDQLLVQARAVAAEVRPAESEPRPLPNLRLRNTAIIGGTAAVIGAYGYHSWWKNGFTGSFHTKREGAFGRDTEFSGIDKLGHAYFNYLGTRALVPVYEAVGNSPAASRALAAWTTWGAMTMVEVLDGFSKDNKFSHEDFIATSIGAGLGWFFASNPAWDDKLDFRLQYRQTPLSNFDPPGDYAGQRFWLMMKADGFEALRDVPVVRYLEFGVGYGAPGIDTPDEWIFHDWALRRREVFVGVSVNLARVVADLFYGGRKSTTPGQRAAEFAFDVLQHPGIAYKGRDLDRHIPPPVCCEPPKPTGSPGR